MRTYAQQLSDEELQQLAAATAGLSGRDLRDIASRTERSWASKVCCQQSVPCQWLGGCNKLAVEGYEAPALKAAYRVAGDQRIAQQNEGKMDHAMTPPCTVVVLDTRCYQVVTKQACQQDSPPVPVCWCRSSATRCRVASCRLLSHICRWLAINASSARWTGAARQNACLGRCPWRRPARLRVEVHVACAVLCGV
jgi:hypothetical protein